MGGQRGPGLETGCWLVGPPLGMGCPPPQAGQKGLGARNQSVTPRDTMKPGVSNGMSVALEGWLQNWNVSFWMPPQYQKKI